MTKNFSISLKNRLALTYALLISLSVGILVLLVNQFTVLMFDNLVRSNIEARSREIVSMISDQFFTDRNRIDTEAIRTIGLYFAEQGYLISLEDAWGNVIWDARNQGMGHHMMGRGMSRRWQQNNLLNQNLQGNHRESFPVFSGNIRLGIVSIETLAPVFYSETESMFLNSLNRLFLFAWILLTVLSIIVSVFLSRTIAKPILKAGDTARQIAQNYSTGKNPGIRINNPSPRINEKYKTREIAELSSSINSLAEELEESERRQSQLSSDIAHELRTPLATLQGSLEAMIDGIYQPDREHLESCHEEVLRLNRMAEDLNILTGFEWNNIALSLSEFNFPKMLSTIVDQWRAAAMEKGIELQLHIEEGSLNKAISADYDRLKQVFINILSNAIKYTDRGRIEINAEKSETGWLTAVSDTGIGIPEEDLPHIFERLYRSDKSRNRSTGGAGIGLSIAAAIIKAHRGKITAENNPSGGTIFKISLYA